MACRDSDKVILSWKPPNHDGGSQVTGYILQAAPAGSKDFSDISKVENKTLNYEVKGLEEGKEYLFRIKAENIAGASPESFQLNKPVKIPPKISKCHRKIHRNFCLSFLDYNFKYDH